MSDLFASPEMAAAYAGARPAVHPRILDIIRPRLRGPVDRALDIGCGAGISTKALEPLARRCFGIDPFEAMIARTAQVAPGASFAVARAEALPFRTGSIDLIAAAGSLDFADLDLFFPEASRVLRAGGAMIVYDFSEGRRFRDSDALETWYAEFQRRYPPPRDCGNDITSRLPNREPLEICLTLTRDFYIDYVLGETNVAEAVRNGVPRETIRVWCEETLGGVFQRPGEEVLFNGYVAFINRADLP